MTAVVRQLELETPRLTLRLLCEDDLEQLYALLSDAEALALWGEALDRGGTRRWIERNLVRYEADGFGAAPSFCVPPASSSATAA